MNNQTLKGKIILFIEELSQINPNLQSRVTQEMIADRILSILNESNRYPTSEGKTLITG